jgi:CheY-like chemotaxis protein
MDSIGTLAGGIAHDFNNILTAIVGYADILRITALQLDPTQQRAIDSILKSSQRAADLVSGLQMLTRPDAGEAGTFDLHRVASEVFQVLRETTDRIIAKEMLVPPGRFPIHGDASALYHALMNLGINAVQAIEQKGPRAQDRVTIEARDFQATEGGPLPLPSGPYVQITVRDTGVGMSSEVQRRAFDPLFTTKEKGERKGQGLGLAMVYNIVVRQHGGLIEVETAEGGGSSFHLYLPRGRAAENGRAGTPAAAQGGTETILVVDDEQAIIALTEEALRQVGYSVLSATDGWEAVEVFRVHRDEIDLVILDRTLPRLAGERVLQQMLHLRPDVKVIVSSGDASIDLSSFPGALRILHKPYSLTLLYGVIRDVLDA